MTIETSKPLKKTSITISEEDKQKLKEYAHTNSLSKAIKILINDIKNLEDKVQNYDIKFLYSLKENQITIINMLNNLELKNEGKEFLSDIEKYPSANYKLSLKYSSELTEKYFDEIRKVKFNKSK